MAPLVAEMVKISACNAGDPSSIPGLGRSPGEGHSYQLSTLAWRIPWTEETGRLQSMGSQRVGYGSATEHACTSITIDSMMEGAQGTKT